MLKNLTLGIERLKKKKSTKPYRDAYIKKV